MAVIEQNTFLNPPFGGFGACSVFSFLFMCCGICRFVVLLLAEIRRETGESFYRMHGIKRLVFPDASKFERIFIKMAIGKNHSIKLIKRNKKLSNIHIFGIYIKLGKNFPCFMIFLAE